jgi:hypothetical protein
MLKTMKQWKIFGLLTLLLVIGFAAQAQNDIVRLQDGSFVRGTIIEYLAGQHVRIQTIEGKVLEYPAADVKSTELGNAGRTAKVLTPQTQGFYNLTGLGLAFGARTYGGLAAAPGLYMENGWQWNKHLMTGLGIGVEYLNNATRLPITANARWKFGSGNLTPYVGLSAGYTLSGQERGGGYYYDSYYAEQQNKGGITTGAQVGFLSQLGPHFGLNAFMGFRYQKFTREYDQAFWNGLETIYVPTTEKTYLNRVTLGFGFLFD